MAIAPTTINIRRKSCIIVFSVVPIPCHRGKLYPLTVFAQLHKCKSVQYFLTNKIAAPRFFAVFSRKVRLSPIKSQVMMLAPLHKGERLAMPA
ncbi:MAG: hypothetical protein E7J78_08865, partial [Pantoea sp.]|nr:hypothetical protein [Pantoea sp.]